MSNYYTFRVLRNYYALIIAFLLNKSIDYGCLWFFGGGLLNMAQAYQGDPLLMFNPLPLTYPLSETLLVTYVHVDLVHQNNVSNRLALTSVLCFRI